MGLVIMKSAQIELTRGASWKSGYNIMILMECYFKNKYTH